MDGEDCNGVCDSGLACIDVGNLNYGFSSFDNMAVGTLLVFQVITVEGWTEIMDKLTEVSGDGLVVAYFVVLVLFGAFFLSNYLLAEICLVFTVKLKVKKRLSDSVSSKDTEERREAQQGVAASVVGFLRSKVTTVYEQAPLLDITVVAARNLAASDLVLRSSDPYVSLRCGGTHEDHAERVGARFCLNPSCGAAVVFGWDLPV